LRSRWSLSGRCSPKRACFDTDCTWIFYNKSSASGGIGKAEGFADGEWANHRQAALAAATQDLEIRDTAHTFNHAGGCHEPVAGSAIVNR
jgi:hypothetical protein